MANRDIRIITDDEVKVLNKLIDAVERLDNKLLPMATSLTTAAAAMRDFGKAVEKAYLHSHHLWANLSKVLTQLNAVGTSAKVINASNGMGNVAASMTNLAAASKLLGGATLVNIDNRIGNIGKTAATSAAQIDLFTKSLLDLSVASKSVGGELWKSINRIDSFGKQSSASSKQVDAFNNALKLLGPTATNAGKRLTGVENHVGGLEAKFDAAATGATELDSRLDMLANSAERVHKNVVDTKLGVSALNRTLDSGSKELTNYANAAISASKTLGSSFGRGVISGVNATKNAVNKVIRSIFNVDQANAFGAEAGSAFSKGIGSSINVSGNRQTIYQGGVSHGDLYVQGMLLGINQNAIALGRQGSRLIRDGMDAFIASGAGLIITGGAAQTAMNFEEQLKLIEVFGDLSVEQVQSVQERIFSVARETVFSPTEQATAYLTLLKSGLSSEDTSNILKQLADFSVASQQTIQEAAESVIESMSLFDIPITDIQRAMDALVGGADISVAAVADLSHALTYAGPSAAALGASIEEVSASIALLSDRGIGANRAGTGLRAFFSSLLKPSDEAQRVMQELGISVSDEMGNFVGMENLLSQFQVAVARLRQDGLVPVYEEVEKVVWETRRSVDEFGNIVETVEPVLKTLYEQTGGFVNQRGLGDTEIAAKLMQLGDRVGVTALLALIDTAEDGTLEFSKYIKELENAKNATEIAAAITQVFKFKLDELASAVDVLNIRAFTPFLNEVIAPLIDQLIIFVNKISNLDKETLKLGLSVVAGGAALIAFYAVLQMALGGLMFLTGGLLTTIGFLTSPVGIALAATTATLAINGFDLSLAGLHTRLSDGLETMREYTAQIAKVMAAIGIAPDTVFSEETFLTSTQRLREEYSLLEQELGSFFDVGRGTHTVTSGDTWYDIAKRNNMTVEELQALNPIDPFSLAVGMKLDLGGDVPETNLIELDKIRTRMSEIQGLLASGEWKNLSTGFIEETAEERIQGFANRLQELPRPLALTGVNLVNAYGAFKAFTKGLQENLGWVELYNKTLDAFKNTMSFDFLGGMPNFTKAITGAFDIFDTLPDAYPEGTASLTITPTISLGDILSNDGLFNLNNIYDSIVTRFNQAFSAGDLSLRPTWLYEKLSEFLSLDDAEMNTIATTIAGGLRRALVTAIRLVVIPSSIITSLLGYLLGRYYAEIRLVINNFVNGDGWAKLKELSGKIMEQVITTLVEIDGGFTARVSGFIGEQVTKLQGILTIAYIIIRGEIREALQNAISSIAFLGTLSYDELFGLVSETFSNVMTTISTAINNTFAFFGIDLDTSRIIETLKIKISGIATWLKDNVPVLIGRLLGETVSIIVYSVPKLFENIDVAGLIGGIRTFLQTIIDTALETIQVRLDIEIPEPVLNFFTVERLGLLAALPLLNNAILPIIANIGSLSSAFSGFFSILGLGLVPVLSIAGIIGLLAVNMAVFGDIKRLGDPLKGFFDKLKESMSILMSADWSGVVSILTAIANVTITLLGASIDWLGDVLVNLATFISDFVTGLSTIISPDVDVSAMDRLLAFLNVLHSFITAIFNVSTEAIEGIFQFLVQGLEDLINAFGGNVDFQSTVDGLSNLSESFGLFLQALALGSLESIGNRLNAIKNFIVESTLWTVDGLKISADAIAILFNAIATGDPAKWTEYRIAVSEFFSYIGDAIKDKFLGAILLATEQLNNLIGVYNTMTGLFGLDPIPLFGEKPEEEDTPLDAAPQGASMRSNEKGKEYGRQLASNVKTGFNEELTKQFEGFDLVSLMFAPSAPVEGFDNATSPAPADNGFGAEMQANTPFAPFFADATIFIDETAPALIATNDLVTASLDAMNSAFVFLGITSTLAIQTIITQLDTMLLRLSGNIFNLAVMKTGFETAGVSAEINTQKMVAGLEKMFKVLEKMAPIIANMAQLFMLANGMKNEEVQKFLGTWTGGGTPVNGKYKGGALQANTLAEFSEERRGLDFEIFKVGGRNYIYGNKPIDFSSPYNAPRITDVGGMRDMQPSYVNNAYTGGATNINITVNADGTMSSSGDYSGLAQRISNVVRDELRNTGYRQSIGVSAL